MTSRELDVIDCRHVERGVPIYAESKVTGNLKDGSGRDCFIARLCRKCSHRFIDSVAAKVQRESGEDLVMTWQERARPKATSATPFGRPDEGELAYAVDELRQRARQLEERDHPQLALALQRVADRIESEWLP